MNNTMVLDTLSTVWYENQLRTLEAKAFTRLLPALKAREVFPVDPTQNPYSKSISFMTYDMTGEAKILSDGALDAPMGDISASETAYPVVFIGAGFDQSNWEIQAAQKLGVDLEARQVNNTYDRIQRLINKLVFKGDDARGIPGLANDASVTSTAATNGSWISGDSADNVLQDLRVQYMRHQDNCAGAHPVTDILIPIKEYNFLATKRSSTYSDLTLLQYIATQLPFVAGPGNIHPVPEMKNFLTTYECCVMYSKTPECMEVKIPQEIFFLPPQVVGFGQRVLAGARCGGLHIHYPKSVDIMYGL